MYTRILLICLALCLIADCKKVKINIGDATLENLDWEAGGSFVSRGLSKNRVVEYGPALLPFVYNASDPSTRGEPSTLVTDTVNRRMFLDMGSGGQYWLFEDHAYVKLNGAPCAKGPFGYRDQLREYGTAIHTDTIRKPGYGLIGVYTGFNRDVGSCDLNIAVSMHQDFDRNAIVRWDWVHPWYLMINGNLTMSTIAGSIEYDRVDNVADCDVRFLDHYFVMPQECVQTTLDYCAPGFLFP